MLPCAILSFFSPSLSLPPLFFQRRWPSRRGFTAGSDSSMVDENGGGEGEMRARRICRDAVNNPVAAAKYSRSAEKLSKSRNAGGI